MEKWKQWTEKSETFFRTIQKNILSITALNSFSIAPCWCMQVKYTKAGRKEASSCLYAALPETLETQHAKEAAELLSQVPNLSPATTTTSP